LLSAPSPLSRTLEVYNCPVLDREQEIVDVGNVINSYKAALAVGVQDPRRGNLDPRVAAGTVQGPQRPLGITRRDANDGWIAAVMQRLLYGLDRPLAFPCPTRLHGRIEPRPSAKWGLRIANVPDLALRWRDGKAPRACARGEYQADGTLGERVRF
jgi:hypothetical protein